MYLSISVFLSFFLGFQLFNYCFPLKRAKLAAKCKFSLLVSVGLLVTLDINNIVFKERHEECQIQKAALLPQEIQEGKRAQADRRSKDIGIEKR